MILGTLERGDDGSNKDSEEFVQGHQWISTIWTQNWISKMLSLLYLLWLVLLGNYCMFSWSGNTVQMQILIMLHFQKAPKRLWCCWPHPTPLAVGKVCNRMYHSPAFLMPWCSFSTEFEEKKKKCTRRIMKHIMGITPKVSLLSPLWCYVRIYCHNTHRPSRNQYKQATINFAAAHNQ